MMNKAATEFVFRRALRKWKTTGFWRFVLASFTMFQGCIEVFSGVVSCCDAVGFDGCCSLISGEFAGNDSDTENERERGVLEAAEGKGFLLDQEESCGGGSFSEVGRSVRSPFAAAPLGGGPPRLCV